MHAFYSEECRQIGSERGQHEYDENPIGGDQNAAADGFRRFAASLRRERSQREPKTLDQSEISTGFEGHKKKKKNVFLAKNRITHENRIRKYGYHNIVKYGVPELFVFGFVVLRAVRRILVQ